MQFLKYVCIIRVRCWSCSSLGHGWHRDDTQLVKLFWRRPLSEWSVPSVCASPKQWKYGDLPGNQEFWHRWRIMLYRHWLWICRIWYYLNVAHTKTYSQLINVFFIIYILATCIQNSHCKDNFVSARDDTTNENKDVTLFRFGSLD